LPDTGLLDGRVALVCGATGPVGMEACRGLAALGASVVVHCRSSRGRAELLAAGLPGPTRHTWVHGDLADPAQALAAVTAATETVGPPDILVDAAYPSAGSQLVRDSSPIDLERHLDGFRMHLNACRAVLPGMRSRGWGRIILIAGALATRVFPGFAFYSGVKAGLIAVTRTLALEEGSAGITVNAIAPGRVGPGEAGTDPAFAALDAVSSMRAALPQLPRPRDIASVAGFLASDAAAAVTGQVIYLAAGEPV
jgi:3-oxoacyl-[acyl-carrier protein] reductase